MAVTYPLANPSQRTPHQGMFIEHTGVMVYTVIVEKGCHCNSDIKVIAADREVEMKNVPFSKYSYLFFATLYISPIRYF